MENITETSENEPTQAHTQETETHETTEQATQETSTERLTIQDIFEKHFGEGAESRRQAARSEQQTSAEAENTSETADSAHEEPISTQEQSQQAEAVAETSKSVDDSLKKLAQQERKARSEMKRLQRLAKADPIALLKELGAEEDQLSDIATDAAYEALGDDAPEEHRLKQLERRMAREKARQEAEKALEQEEADQALLENYTAEVGTFLESEISKYPYLSAAYAVNKEGLTNEILGVAAKTAQETNTLPKANEIDLAALNKQAETLWGPIVDRIVEERLKESQQEAPKQPSQTNVALGSRRPSGAGATKQPKPPNSVKDVIAKWAEKDWQ